MQENQKINIRKATPSDDLAIGELLVEAFVHAYALKKPDFDVPEQRKSDLRNVASRRSNSVIFVAERENEIMGTITLAKTHDPTKVELTMLALNPRLQGSGLGRTIMSHTLEFAKSSGYKQATLHIRENLHGLEKFYRSFGFERAMDEDKTVYSDIRLFGYLLRF